MSTVITHLNSTLYASRYRPESDDAAQVEMLPPAAMVTPSFDAIQRDDEQTPILKALCPFAQLIALDVNFTIR